MAEKKRYALLDVLRVAAILLVLNFHFDPLYPIPALATGGAAGNGLFFVLSGYCLRLQPGFLRHMGRRALRLYPGVWIAFIAQLIIGGKAITGIGDAIAQLIWPTAFWFVGAILLFDALLYVLEKLDFTRHFGLFTLGMAALYAACHLLIVDKTKWSVEEAGLATPQQAFKLAFVFSFAFKLVLERVPSTMPLQFLTQLAIVCFTFGAVICALAWEPWWTRVSAPWLRRAISAFAAVLLEMYLVQFPIISMGKALPFPANVAVVVPLTALFAFLLHAADNAIYRLGLPLIPQQKG